MSRTTPLIAVAVLIAAFVSIPSGTTAAQSNVSAPAAPAADQAITGTVEPVALAVVDPGRLMPPEGEMSAEESASTIRGLAVDLGVELVLDRHAGGVLYASPDTDMTAVIAAPERMPAARAWRLEVPSPRVAVITAGDSDLGVSLSAVAERLGLTLILDTAGPRSFVAWADDALDITEPVTSWHAAPPAAGSHPIPAPRLAVLDIERVLAQGRTRPITRAAGVTTVGSGHPVPGAEPVVDDVPIAIACIAKRLELDLVLRHPWPGVVHSEIRDVTAQVAEELRRVNGERLRREKISTTRRVPRTRTAGLFFGRLRQWHQSHVGVSEIQVRGLLGNPAATREPAPNHVCCDDCYDVQGEESCGWMCFNAPPDKAHMSVNGSEAPPTPE